MKCCTSTKISIRSFSLSVRRRKSTGPLPRMSSLANWNCLSYKKAQFVKNIPLRCNGAIWSDLVRFVIVDWCRRKLTWVTLLLFRMLFGRHYYLFFLTLSDACSNTETIILALWVSKLWETIIDESKVSTSNGPKTCGEGHSQGLFSLSFGEGVEDLEGVRKVDSMLCAF